jgi:hypothetical protein
MNRNPFDIDDDDDQQQQQQQQDMELNARQERRRRRERRQQQERIRQMEMEMNQLHMQMREQHEQDQRHRQIRRERLEVENERLRQVEEAQNGIMQIHAQLAEEEITKRAHTAIENGDFDLLRSLWPGIRGETNKHKLLWAAISYQPPSSSSSSSSSSQSTTDMVYKFVTFMVPTILFFPHIPVMFKEELIRAADNGRFDIFLYLIENAREIDIVSDVYLLAHAVKGGSFSLLKYLVEHGMDPKSPHAFPREYPAAATAARYGRLDMLRFFVELCAVDVHDHGDKALYVCVENDHVDILAYLHSKKCDIHAFDDSLVATASLAGALDCVQYLVEHDANFHTSNERAFVNAAKNMTERQHVAIMTYLVEQGVDMSVGVVQDVLIECIYDHNVTCLALLLKAGAFSVQSLRRLIQKIPGKEHVFLYIVDWLQYFILQNLVQDVLLEAQVGGNSNILPPGVEQAFLDIAFSKAMASPEFHLLRVLVEIRPLTKDTQQLVRRGLLGQLIMMFRKMPISVYEERRLAQVEKTSVSLQHFEDLYSAMQNVLESPTL